MRIPPQITSDIVVLRAKYYMTVYMKERKKRLWEKWAVKPHMV